MNPLDYMGDTELIKKKYRLDCGSIFILCDVLGEALQRKTYRNHALPVLLQIILALPFYVTESFQCVIADSHGVGIDSVSKSISVVSSELAKKIDEYIRRLDLRVCSKGLLKRLGKEKKIS